MLHRMGGSPVMQCTVVLSKTQANSTRKVITCQHPGIHVYNLLLLAANERLSSELHKKRNIADMLCSSCSCSTLQCWPSWRLHKAWCMKAANNGMYALTAKFQLTLCSPVGRLLPCCMLHSAAILQNCNRLLAEHDKVDHYQAVTDS